MINPAQRRENNAEQLDSSVEMRSPSPVAIQPRRLRFVSPGTEGDNEPREAVSPPYRKVRALRLFDTPATPKTIIQKSAANHLSAVAQNDMLLREQIRKVKTVERPRSLPLHNRTLDIGQSYQKTANINPFTPDSLMARNKKRCRTMVGRENISNQSMQHFLNSDDDSGDAGELASEIQQAPKRLALQETNISRYQKEFIEVDLIGAGEFGLVHECLNRLDGCTYAIKRSIKPVAGSSFEKRALNEVWAHAVLGKHDNVVRYYSAWAEDNHMLIQNEFCNGGSLQAHIVNGYLAESELKILLLHVAEGLRYIHANDLVHMDLKPGNIFLTKEPAVLKTTLPPLTIECYETGMAGIYQELTDSECVITYKIGDLGHVTSVKEPTVEEGDCRYLPKEILEENYTDLFKADIFSLGITLYEVAGGGELLKNDGAGDERLPKNGEEWHNLREGRIPFIPTLSAEFNELIKSMMHPDPKLRPSSTSIFNNPLLNSLEAKTKAQLSQELAIEKRKNQMLLGKLREAKKLLKLYEQNARANKFSLRSPKMLSGQRCLRSTTRKKPDPEQKLHRLRDSNKNVINMFDRKP